MRKTNSKELIIESAEKLFAEKGYDETSVDEITKNAGLAKSLFFYYFEKKVDVLYELVKLKIKKVFKEFLETDYPNYVPKDKDEVYYITSQFIKKHNNIFKAAVFEFMKTHEGMDLITRFPGVVFDNFCDFFEFKEEDSIKLIAYSLRTVIFESIRGNVCLSYGVDESFVRKCTKDVVGSGFFGAR